MKKVYVSLFVAILLIFLEVTSKISIGKVINSLFPCKQNPANSFPCYGNYDIYFIATLIIFSMICAIYLLIKIIHKFRNLS